MRILEKIVRFPFVVLHYIVGCLSFLAMIILLVPCLTIEKGLVKLAYPKDHPVRQAHDKVKVFGRDDD